MLNSTDWLGTHYYRIKSTLGTYDPDPNSRGNNGLYGTVYSDPVPVTIINPCMNSTVNSDEGMLVEEIFVPINKTEWDWTYEGPTNSMSLIYGNGYDKCGPLKYSFLDDAGLPFSLFALSNYTSFGYNKPDNLTFNIQSYRSGYDLKANFTLKVELSSYPTSYPYYQTVEVTYRECYPEDFSGPEVETPEMTVGDDGFNIDVFFDQFPCDYEQEYTIKVIDKKTGFQVDVPGFIDHNGDLVIIKTPEGRDIGEYEV